MVAAIKPTSQTPTEVTPYYQTELLVLRGDPKVSSFKIEDFEPNGTLRRREERFGWMDTLWLGSAITYEGLLEPIDLGIVTATTNEREINKRRPVLVTGTQVDFTPYFRRCYLRLGK